jgi:hypothetical protein
VVTAPLAGFGVALYGVSALFATLTAAPTAGPPVDWRRSAGTGMLGLAAVLAARAAGLRVGGPGLLWAVLLTGAGLALFWGAAGARRPDDSPWPDDRDLRTGLGLVLTVGGGAWALSWTGLFDQAAATIVGTSAALAIGLLVAGPWWLRTRRLLSAERIARARAQERADLADHLHDSVLQTLALIQRSAGDRSVVASLAHRQERELRDWLLQRPAASLEASLDGALRGAVAAVEDAYAVAVEVVIVGDAPLDAGAEALVAATGEALTNAAKQGGGAAISLFARVQGDRIAVYVHDRGPGFDPAAIGPERHGVRESIIGRMTRHGGHAEIESAPGAGCEVVLGLERR